MLFNQSGNNSPRHVSIALKPYFCKEKRTLSDLRKQSYTHTDESSISGNATNQVSKRVFMTPCEPIKKSRACSGVYNNGFDTEPKKVAKPQMCPLDSWESLDDILHTHEEKSSSLNKWEVNYQPSSGEKPRSTINSSTPTPALPNPSPNTCTTHTTSPRPKPTNPLLTDLVVEDSSSLTSNIPSSVPLKNPLSLARQTHTDSLSSSPLESPALPYPLPKRTNRDSPKSPPTISTSKIRSLDEVPTKGLRFKDMSKIIIKRVFDDAEKEEAQKKEQRKLEKKELQNFANSNNSQNRAKKEQERAREEVLNLFSQDLGPALF